MSGGLVLFSTKLARKYGNSVDLCQSAVTAQALHDGRNYKITTIKESIQENPWLTGIN
jgi:uncharacterized protein (UPF0179 family)